MSTNSYHSFSGVGRLTSNEPFKFGTDPYLGISMEFSLQEVCRSAALAEVHALLSTFADYTRVQSASRDNYLFADSNPILLE